MECKLIEMKMMDLEGIDAHSNPPWPPSPLCGGCTDDARHSATRTTGESEFEKRGNRGLACQQ